MGEIKQLRTELDAMAAKLRESETKNREILKAFSNSVKILEEKDRLAAEVEKLQKFKDDAKPRLTEFSKILAERNQAVAKLREFSAHTQKLRGNLERADLAFHKTGASDLEESQNHRQGTHMALLAVLGFLRECGVRQKLCWPLINLRYALNDAEKGIKNPITAAVKFNMGRPTGSEESNQKVIASWAVTGLHRLGETKKKAYDIVAETAGLPRVQLLRYRQALISPKKKGPKGAQEIYDFYEAKVGDSPERLQEYVENMLNILRYLRGN